MPRAEDAYAVLGGGRAVARKGKGVNLLGADEFGKRGPQSPEARAAASERMKKLHADPAFAKAHAERGRERMKKLNADPKLDAKRIAAVSAAQKARWAKWRKERGK